MSEVYAFFEILSEDLDIAAYMKLVDMYLS